MRRRRVEEGGQFDVVQYFPISLSETGFPKNIISIVRKTSFDFLSQRLDTADIYLDMNEKRVIGSRYNRECPLFMKSSASSRPQIFLPIEVYLKKPSTGRNSSGKPRALRRDRENSKS